MIATLRQRSSDAVTSPATSAERGRSGAAQRGRLPGFIRLATAVGILAAAAVLADGAFVSAKDDTVRAALNRLVAAYPDALAGHDATTLRWRDGTVMPLTDGSENATFEQRLRHASILDQLSIPYPRGPLAKPPGVDDDPGRLRSTAFFTKMYGD